MFAFNTLTVTLSIISNYLEFLLVVGGNEELISRLERGCNSSISIEGKWVLKKAPDEDRGFQLFNEWSQLLMLSKKGIKFVPQLHPDWKQFMEVESMGLKTRLIDNGASLGDYFQALLEGKVSLETFSFLLAETKAHIKELNSLGVYHNDFHEDNILIDFSLEKGFKVYIIDFGHACKHEPFPGSDIETLKEGLSFILFSFYEKPENIPYELKQLTK